MLQRSMVRPSGLAWAKSNQKVMHRSNDQAVYFQRVRSNTEQTDVEDEVIQTASRLLLREGACHVPTQGLSLCDR